MMAPLNTFIIYSREDTVIKDALLKHLSLLVNKGLIKIWHDGNLLAGESWGQKISAEIRNSRLILFLVSASSLDSNFINNHELKLAFDHRKKNGTIIVPIIVRSCAWELDNRFNDIQAIPNYSGQQIEPITSKKWDNEDQAFTEVIKRLNTLIESAPPPSDLPAEPDLDDDYDNLADVSSPLPPPSPLPTSSSPLPEPLPLSLVRVEGGSFDMGNNAFEDERPVHKVYLNDFYIGKFLVTQDLWIKVMGNRNVSRFQQSLNLPVENVSWYDTQVFLERLGKINGLKYRLPTESEWEFAAIGGRHSYSQKFLYSGSNTLSHCGWFRDNSQNKTQPVNTLLPNKLGIYQMSGNVWEWVEDNWHLNYKDAPTTGEAWKIYGKAERVIRGGSWASSSNMCRVSSRESKPPETRLPYVGFRIALTPI